jgi:hypothetical protein
LLSCFQIHFFRVDFSFFGGFCFLGVAGKHGFLDFYFSGFLIEILTINNFLLKSRIAHHFWENPNLILIETKTNPSEIRTNHSID